MHDASDGVAAEAVSERLREGGVEVRADVASGARTRERVAGAASLDEQLLAVHEVGTLPLEIVTAAARERRRASAVAATETTSPPRLLIISMRDSIPKPRRDSSAYRSERLGGSGSSSSRPSAAAITPRATPSHDQRSRTVATIASRVRSRGPPAPAPSHASSRPAEPFDDRALQREGEQRRRPPGGAASASAPATSARPGVVGADRQRPAGGRLGRDHPERLREGAGDDLGGERRQQVAQLVVLQPPGPDDPLAQQRGGRRGSGRARPGRRRGGRGSSCSSRSGLPSGPPSAARPSAAIAATAPRSPAASAFCSRSSAAR